MLYFIILFGLHLAAGDVSVLTPKGTIIGHEATDGNYTTFFGVPYARVNDENRFGDSLQYPYFATPFNASDPNVKCPQVIFSEEGVLQCLILNIYVPKVANNTGIPVYVWFHGGGFVFGSAGEYDPKHLVEQDIIVITANYRQGPYGFLCTSDTKNQGLSDQKKALKWVKHNIRSFGGDPDKVTIGGESYGAGMVDFLIYSDAPFKQAILQSGTRFSFGISSAKDNDAPIELAAKLGSQFTDHKKAVEFLNTVDPIALMRATRDLGFVFGVCEKAGDSHVKRKYLERVKNTPIIIGYNSKESFSEFVGQPELFYQSVKNIFLGNIRKLFNVNNETLVSITDIVIRFYLGEKTISENAMLELIDLASDFRVNFGAERSTTIYLTAQNPNVYKYLFSYTGGSQYSNMTGVGAHHTEELRYLFNWGAPLQTEEQFNIRKWMVKLWTNFIKFGNPTPHHGKDGWLPTNMTSRPYLNIDVESEMRSHVYHQRMAFWQLLWTAYGRYRRNLPTTSQ